MFKSHIKKESNSKKNGKKNGKRSRAKNLEEVRDENECRVNVR